MADPPHDSRDPVDEALEGWGAPPPRPQFADDVLARVGQGPSNRRYPGWLRWAVTFAIGAVAGGIVVSAIPTLRRTPSTARTDHGGVLEGPEHVRLSGVADVVAEPGARVRWKTLPGGHIALQVVRGVVWARIDADGAGIRVSHGADVITPGTCERIEVALSSFNKATDAELVDCDLVVAAIDTARAGAR